MALTPEEKLARKRERMMDTLRPKSPGNQRNDVAKVFQRMIRAESACKPGLAGAVHQGSIIALWQPKGCCVCVTCGAVWMWDSKQMNTGHFLAGRSAAIVFEEDNVAPQCSHCNRELSGNQGNYRLWMEHVRGQDVIDRLIRRKTESIRFSVEELVDMKLGYMERLKAAEKEMQDVD